MGTNEQTMETKTKLWFNNDVVAYTTEYGLFKYGLVVDGNTEMYTETSPSEENTIEVKWYPEGNDEVISGDLVVLLDRTFIPGDKVFKMDLDSKRQFGYVDSVEKQASVKILNTVKVLDDVHSSSLTNVKKFNDQSIVLYDSTWVGEVLSSTYNVTFTTCDGFQFVIHNPKRRHFSVIEKYDIFGTNENLFYPGVRMLTCAANLSSLKFKHSNEVSKLKLKLYLKKKRLREPFEIYVTKTVVASVTLKWKFQTSIESRQLDDDFPSTRLSGKSLSRLISLDLFNPTFIELGNQYWCKTKKTDSFKTVKSWNEKFIEDLKNGPGSLSNPKFIGKFVLTKQPVRITIFLGRIYKSSLKTEMRLPKTYKWTKSGISKHSLSIIKRNRVLKSFIAKRKKLNVPLSKKKSTNVVVEACKSKHMVNVIWQDGTKELILATDLSPAVGVLNPEFFPGNFVREKKNDSSTVYGVVEYVDYLTRTACVQWFNDEKPGYPSMPTLMKKSQHSVYDLNPHSEYIYDNQKIILHMVPVGDDPNFLKFSVALLLRAEPDGRISLMFSNGEIAQCWPQELWNPKLSSCSLSDDDNHLLLKKYLVDIPKPFTTGSILSTSNPTIKIETSSEISNSSIELFSNTTTKDGLTGASLPKDILSGVPEQIIEDTHTKLQVEKYDSSDVVTQDWKNIYQTLMETSDHNTEKPEVDGKEGEDGEENNVLAKSEEAGVFEILDSCPRHRYISDKDAMCTQMLKVINKEVKILQNSLPAGIWVKMYEERMDLLSVMIRGPEDTPYAGGLYLFDIKLPANYPFIPPYCHYYSFCEERLNPNLYVEGKVCLSLLGTWHGNEDEQWSPGHSNLLQILVSIQGLIFVSEPYYNEPGMEFLRNENMTKDTSRVYNELVLMKVIQSMTNMLARGPVSVGSFAPEVLEHFKCHGPKMVETFEHWMENSGKEIGEGDDDVRDPGYPLLPLSKGFCLSVTNTVNAFKAKLSEIFGP